MQENVNSRGTVILDINLYILSNDLLKMHLITNFLGCQYQAYRRASDFYLKGPTNAGPTCLDRHQICAGRCRIQNPAQTIRESIWTDTDRPDVGTSLDGSVPVSVGSAASKRSQEMLYFKFYAPIWNFLCLYESAPHSVYSSVDF